MPLARIIRNQQFLTGLIFHPSNPVFSKSKQSLIINCTLDQLESILEIFYNVTNYKFNEQELRALDKCKPMIDFIKTQKEFDEYQIKKYLSDNNTFLSIVISIVLTKLFLDSFVEMCDCMDCSQ